MYLNEFADGLAPLDLSASAEFRSLLQSAADLGIPHEPGVRYVSRNTVLHHSRLHFLEWGDPGAPPVLLLHGGNQSAHSWDLVALHLADRYHVIALDQRGHGDSEWVRDADYSPAAMADDALALIAAEGLERPLVMGHSMGGRVTMELLSQAVDVPRAVVFVDIGPDIGGEGTATIRDFIQSNVEFEELDEFVQRVTAYDPYRSREHIERTVRYNLLQRSDGRYVSKSDRLLHDRDFSERRRRAPVHIDDVHAFDLPALVVRGGNSNVLSQANAESFVAALPQGRLVTVPDCGHNVHSQNTPGFLDAVRPFLDDVDR